MSKRYNAKIINSNTAQYSHTKIPPQEAAMTPTRGTSLERKREESKSHQKIVRLHQPVGSSPDRFSDYKRTLDTKTANDGKLKLTVNNYKCNRNEKSAKNNFHNPGAEVINWELPGSFSAERR